MDLTSALIGTTVAALFLAAAVWRPSNARVALFVLDWKAIHKNYWSKEEGRGRLNNRA